MAKRSVKRSSLLSRIPSADVIKDRLAKLEEERNELLILLQLAEDLEKAREPKEK